MDRARLAGHNVDHVVLFKQLYLHLLAIKQFSVNSDSPVAVKKKMSEM